MEGKITGVLYAVFRINENKIKNIKQIKHYQAHMNREKETLNADETRTIFNRQLIGTSDIYKDFKNHISGTTNRSNCNLAHEIILTASKGYFDNVTIEQKEMWIDANIKFLQKYFGDSCINAILHMDETSPHLHCLISNRTKDRWGRDTINNSVFFDGAAKLRKWQDDYSAAMSQFNLSRGIRFSKAHHVKIRQFYSLIEDNMNMEKLNSLLDNVYRYNYIKEEFEAIGKQIEAYRTIGNNNLINTLKKELYKLSSITTAPEKFYDATKEAAQQKEVKALMQLAGINIDIDYLYRETQVNRKETNLETTARIIRETQLKREVLEFKKIIKHMGSDIDIKDNKIEACEKQIHRLKEDKDLYKMVIRTVSEYYHIPQQSIESIVRQLDKNVEAGAERQIKKEV